MLLPFPVCIRSTVCSPDLSASIWIRFLKEELTQPSWNSTEALKECKVLWIIGEEHNYYLPVVAC